MLILDGKMGKGIERTVLANDAIRSRVDYVTFHDYAPGPVNSNLKKAGDEVESNELTAGDWWRAWVAMPGNFSEGGENVALGNRIDFVRSLGYKIAVTEWNWNGWGYGELDPIPEVNWDMASAIGTAGFLHGLMRQGNDVEIACQSLLIGANWDITSIRVDPEEQAPPHFLPQGQMAFFYNDRHGSKLLNVEATNVLRYRQPFSMGWANRPEIDITTVDLVATADENNLYIHAINRALDQALPITLDLSAFSRLSDAGVHHIFAKRSNPSWVQSLVDWVTCCGQAATLEIAEIREQPLLIEKPVITVILPSDSVSILSIPRA